MNRTSARGTSRRLAALLGASAIVLAACGAGASPTPEKPSGKIVVSNWDLYFPEDLIANFTKETGVEVEWSKHTTNEDIIGKLDAANGTGFDVVFVSAPFFIRSARTGIASVDRDLEDAARVDGASERQLFRSITVPLASAALAAGLVMTWARSLGEFGATIMFAGNVAGRTQTLPLLVYGEFQAGDLDASIAAAAVLVVAAAGVLVAVRVLHWGRALDTATR